MFRRRQEALASGGCPGRSGDLRAGRGRRAALGLGLLLLAGAPPWSQAQFDANLGRVVGTVVDISGSVLPGASVAVRDIGSGRQRAATTDGAGYFRVGALPPGAYTVTASLDGFASATASGVVVQVGGAVRVDLELGVAEVHEEVQVAAAMLDAMLPASSNVVADRVFNNLPINGRRFHDFALLTPTVQVSRAAGHLSFGAQRGIYTNVKVDGADYNQSFFGGIQGGERAGSAMTVPQSAIQEFQTVTSGFTAEYGRTTSGVVNVSTKSGSNELRGDAFYQARHPQLGLSDPFGTAVLERLQQFGGSVGGPLRRDRLFGFFALERQLSRSPRYVEFPQLAGADRERGAEAYDFFKSLEQPFDATNNAWALTPRLDSQLRGGGLLMVRYNYSSSTAENAVSVGDPTQPRTTEALSNNGTEKNSIHFLTAQLTSLISPTVVNQLRLTVTREQRPRVPNARMPTVSTGLGDFGTRSFLPTIETDLRPVLSNSTVLHAGAHDLKIGGSADRIWIEDQFGYNQFGHFLLFSSDPEEILDILTPGGRIPNRFDAPGLYFRQIGNTVGEQRVGNASLYIQDSWRATSELTLDLGFRWEGQFNQSPFLGNETLIRRVRAAEFPFGAPDPAVLPNSVRQWMPRVGFAYSPRRLGRNLVWRGSAGVFYAITPPVFLNSATKAYREPAFNLSVTLPASEPTVYRQFLAAGIDLNRNPLAALPAFSPEEVARVLGGDPHLGASPSLLHPGFRNPRAVKYSLAAEFSPTARTVAGVQWMRHYATGLHGVRDYNLAPAAVRPGDPARIPFYDPSLRPAPSLGQVLVTESIGRSDYNGVTANFQYRGDRLQLVGHYTLAKAFSSDINEGDFWGPLYTDQGRPEDAYGPSNLDLRHQLTGHAVARLPGGVTWSAILRATSGPPLSPAAGADLNGDTLASDRALASPGRYFGRNVFRNLGTRSVDMRVLRAFALTAARRVELSAELFNAFNLDNIEYGAFNQVYGPGLDLATGEQIGRWPSFLRLRAADGGYDRNNQQVFGIGPLQVQLGLRLFF